MSLTPPERETIINGSDADDTVTIWTAQRPVITKLRKNPAAALLDEGLHEGSAWAKFELPADLLSFRSGRVKRAPLTDEQRHRRAEHLRGLRATA